MDNGAKARVLADYKFCEQIKNLWLNKLIIIEVYNLKDFTWFLSNFYSYKATNIAAFTKNEVIRYNNLGRISMPNSIGMFANK